MNVVHLSGFVAATPTVHEPSDAELGGPRVLFTLGVMGDARRAHFFVTCVCFGGLASLAATLGPYAELKVVGKLCWCGGDCNAFYITLEELVLVQELLPPGHHDASVPYSGARVVPLVGAVEGVSSC